MEKKGQIFEEISPIAIGLAILAALIGYYSAREVSFFWRIITTVGTGVIGFVIANKMANG